MSNLPEKVAKLFEHLKVKILVRPFEPPPPPPREEELAKVVEGPENKNDQAGEGNSDLPQTTPSEGQASLKAPASTRVSGWGLSAIKTRFVEVME